MEIVYERGSLSAEAVLKYLFLSGGADAVIRDCMIRQEVAREGNKLGIAVSDEDLQSFADEYRALRGLHYSRDMITFLQSKGLSVDDFEQFCEESLMSTLLKKRLADEETVKTYFLNHRSRFDRARLSMITVEDENLAQELAMRIAEDGEDFHSLAREYSIDAYKNAGGYIGPVRREGLPPEMAAKIFNAGAGELAGPFTAGKQHQLFLIEEMIKAELNEAVNEEVKEMIFNEWAARFFQKGFHVTI